MTTRIGRAKLQTKDGRTRLEPARGHRSVSARIGQKKQADREEAKWRAKSKHKV